MKSLPCPALFIGTGCHHILCTIQVDKALFRLRFGWPLVAGPGPRGQTWLGGRRHVVGVVEEASGLVDRKVAVLGHLGHHARRQGFLSLVAALPVARARMSECVPKAAREYYGAPRTRKAIGTRKELKSLPMGLAL